MEDRVIGLMMSISTSQMISARFFRGFLQSRHMKTM